VDVNGVWNVSFVTPQGNRDAQVNLKQAGEKVTGTISSEAGETALEGAIKEKSISMGFTYNTENGSIAITMNGTVEGDTMKGTADLAGMGQMEWSGARAAKAAAPAAAPAQGTATDVTGEWILTVQTDGGGGSPTFIFKQSGETLTGQYKGNYGQAPLSGTVKGKDIAFSYTMEIEGTSIVMAYTGTVEKDEMKGTIRVGDLGQGSFTGKRKQ
jgi:hypothetical protein